VEDGYRVSRSDTSGAWTDLARLPANTTTYSDATVSANATYVYRVQALKDGGSSDYSNEAVGVIATSRPSAPSDLAVTIWADQEGYGWLYFNASWTDASTNEEGFRLEVSDDGVSGWGTESGAPANVSSSFAKYDLLLAAPFGACYRVIAFNAAGDSDPSSVFCTGWGEYPSDLVGTAVDQQSIDLSWTDNARFESGYWVIRAKSSDGMYEFVASLPANATSYHDTGLASGQEYWYTVSVAYPQNGISDYFNYAWLSASTLPP
jgi:hypothetical protein